MEFKSLLTKQQEQLTYFFHHLDCDATEKIFEKLSECCGTLFFTGVGKSGFIAKKIAATLQSTGTKALFLSPIDALHGDLGIVDSKDSIIFLSKSGETQELLDLIPPLRAKGCLMMTFCSNPQSRLAQSVAHHLELPCLGELCPFDLAPTTSSELQLLIGDLLTVYLMDKKRFSLDQYALNHPNGQIGKRAHYKVHDLMVKNERVPVCLPTQSLAEVLADFTEKSCGCMVVVDEGQKLAGIFTDGDLRRALQKSGPSVLKEKIENLMTKTPRYITQKDSAWSAIQLMEANQKQPIMVLPVLDEEKQKVVGILKMHDLIQAGL